jgi:hypothetical protein
MDLSRIVLIILSSHMQQQNRGCGYECEESAIDTHPHPSILLSVFTFQYRGNHQCKSIEIYSYNFCRDFHGASFKKRIKVLSSVCAEIFEEQSMLQTFWHTDSNTVSLAAGGVLNQCID